MDIFPAAVFPNETHRIKPKHQHHLFNRKSLFRGGMHRHELANEVPTSESNSELEEEPIQQAARDDLCELGEEQNLPV